jgi:hypothetical protein
MSGTVYALCGGILTLGLHGRYISGIWGTSLSHLRIVWVVPPAIMSAISCRWAGMCRRWVWKVVPQHRNEAIRDLCTQAAVGGQPLQHLNAIFEEELLVIERLSRCQSRDGFEREPCIFET